MKKTLMLFIFIIFSLSCFANTNYSNVGQNNFVLGTGFFNANMQTDVTYTRAINDPKLMPLVADLDNDGKNEIVILDGTTFKLFQEKTLNSLDAYSFGAITGEPNFILYDIDGDNYTELIVTCSCTDNVFILEYNGTSFYEQTNFNVGGADHLNGESMVKCGGVDDCVYIYSYSTSSDFNTASDMNIKGFNSTGTTTANLQLKQHNGFGSVNRNGNFCLPRIKTVAYEDYDNDGNSEYIFSYAYVTELSTDDKQAVINYVYFNGTSMINEMEITENSDVFDAPDDFTCTGVEHWDQYFTSPLVANIDGFTSNGYETVIGLSLDSDEFKMHSYDSNGADIDSYPEIFDADGLLVSNVFLADVFTNSNEVDFCVVGYDTTDEKTDITCASEIGSESILGISRDTLEFMFETDNYHNMTDTYGDYSVIAHATQQSTTTYNGKNQHEVLNSYGVFSLDFDSCGTLGTCDANLIYENPVGESKILSVDLEQVGREDLIALTTTNLWYVDDGFSNSPAEISEYTINPCIDSTWKLNTSVGVTITAYDTDSDSVQARAVLYSNNISVPLQDSGWSTTASSGTTFSFMFEANSTVASDVLTLYVNDTGNGEVQELDIAFSVASVGVEYGDCITNFEQAVTEEDEEEQAFQSDNAVKNAVDDIKSSTNMSMSDSQFWVFGMVVLALFIYFGTSGQAGDKLFNIMIIEFLALILGVILGFLGVGYIFALVIIAIAVIVLKINSKVTGG